MIHAYCYDTHGLTLIILELLPDPRTRTTVLGPSSDHSVKKDLACHTFRK